MTRNEFVFKEHPHLWGVKTVSIPAENITDGPTYALRQLYDKVAIVKKYAAAVASGSILDIGCATGETLRLFDEMKTRVGIDFSERYINEAISRSGGRDEVIRFVIGDATALPFDENAFDIAYSFSVLCSISNLIAVFQSIWRVLKPGGVAILDCGNIRSLNALCVRRYVKEDGWASLECPTIGKTLAMLRGCGFEILQRRCYQLLPLYARKPRWLWPLLHPVWERAAAKRIRGKMLDEWVSSLPVLRSFAFRHVIVCGKQEAVDAGAEKIP